MKRFLRAFLIAPLTTPILYWAIALMMALADPYRRSQALRDPLGGVAFVLAFGAPIAYGATLVAVGPAIWLLRHAGRWALGTLLALGAAVGLVTAFVLRPHLGGDPFRVPLPPWEGAVLGVASAGVFWWLAARAAHPAADSTA